MKYRTWRCVAPELRRELEEKQAALEFVEREVNSMKSAIAAKEQQLVSQVQ